MEQPLWKGEPARLSYSSMTLLTQCERKYYLKKVQQVAPDPDAEDSTESLDVGKAFHKVLEDNWHRLDGVSLAIVRNVVLSFETLNESYHVPLVVAMLRRYKEANVRAGLRAVACEIEVATAHFIGYVDAVMVDESGGWWIVDLKTAASYSPFLAPTLPLNPQLNLYAYHADLIAEFVGLDVADFRGCRYINTTKSKIKRRAGESTPDYIGRLYKSVETYDYPIYRDELRTSAVYDEFVRKWRRANELYHQVDPKPSPNLQNCTLYHRPCEFWSQCYGRLFTESGDRPLVTSGGAM